MPTGGGSEGREVRRSDGRESGRIRPLRHRTSRFTLTLPALFLIVSAAVAPAFTMTPSVKRAGMAAIPAGTYHPLYADGAPPVVVHAFSIDRAPVTRAQFLAFGRAHPAWLTGVDASQSRLDRPVTDVTWSAARAYCAAQGKRLPTTAEWEYVAAADEKRRDATRDPAFLQLLVSLYTTRPDARIGGAGERFRNVYGVSALHGVVWEWTSDFDGGKSEHAKHAAMTGMDHEGGGHEHMLSCASAAIGASNAGDYAAFMRYQFRAGLTRSSAQQMLGFRCAI
jgi:formylglycine-generating enzyme required for sulfatase activity